MNCNNIENKIILYIDNELSMVESALVNEHIRTCERCNSLVNDIKKTYQISIIDKDIKVSSNFFTKIQQKIENPTIINNLYFSPFIKKLLVAASISILLISTLLSTMFYVNYNNSSDEIVFNEFQQEPIETYLLNE